MAPIRIQIRYTRAVWLMPAMMWGCEGPIEPRHSLPPAPAPAAVVVASGDDQHAKAGERLPEPLRVRVTDAGGAGLRDIRVTWTLTSGAGRFLGYVDGEIPAHHEILTRGATHTSFEGFSRVYFIPMVHGRSLVTASLEADSATVGRLPVTFTVDANGVVVTFGPSAWDEGPKDCQFDDGWWEGVVKIPTGFAGPDCSSNVVVPVGMPIEWVNKLDLVRVASSSVPPGGASFDSGPLLNSDRFRFVPAVPGVWRYLDRNSGETGTITALANDWSAWRGSIDDGG